MVFMMTKGKAKESEDTDVVEGPTPNEEETEEPEHMKDESEEATTLEVKMEQIRSDQMKMDELSPPRKELDDELLTTIELLMEAYSEKTVDGQELLEPFTELLEVLRESEEKTDQEIKDVLLEVIGIIQEES
ncbi:unnamed protein product [Durusdinium trenchii]